MILKGIRIIDATQWAFGPYCAALLCDLGAEVIKVEEPESGDGGRHVAKVRDYSFAKNNPFFEILHRGKKGFAINLKSQKGREILLELVGTADIFITAQRPHSLKKLGIDYETLKISNPRLIYALCGSFGQKGPLADKPAWDGSAFAMSGLTYTMQDKQGVPIPPPQGMGDLASSVTMAYGIMSALFHRERTGEGQKVEVSLFGTMVTVLGALCMQATTRTGMNFPQFDSSKSVNPMLQNYRTKDNRWLLLNMHQTDPYWHSFCETIGLSQYEHDPRFEGHSALCDHSKEATEVIQEVFLKKTLQEWIEILSKTDLVWAPIYKMEEAQDHPQIIENEFVVSYQDREGRKIKTVGSPVKWSGVKLEIEYTAPELGQHTEEILLELGYNWDDIAKLKDDRVIR